MPHTPIQGCINHRSMLEVKTMWLSKLQQLLLLVREGLQDAHVCQRACYHCCPTSSTQGVGCVAFSTVSALLG
jgi:hypothetical protein